MKVRDLLHTPRDVPRSWGTTGIAVGLLFVVIVTQDEAEQETWHHNVSDPQHREVAACGTREQLKLGWCPRQAATCSRLLHCASARHFARPFLLPANSDAAEAKRWLLKVFFLRDFTTTSAVVKHTHSDSNGMLLQTSLVLSVVFKLLVLLTHSAKQIHQLGASTF